jgi:hypothetical protein
MYNGRLRRSAREAEWRKAQPNFRLSSFHAQSLCTKLESRYFLSFSEEQNKVAAMYQMEIALPLADRDVISFVMAAPPEAYSAGAVPRGMLRQALRGVVPDPILDRRWKGDCSSYVNAAMSAKYAQMVSSLQSAGLILKHRYVEQGSLGPQLEQLKAQIQANGPTCEAALSLQKLCRLELWLRVFFGEEQNNRAEVTPCSKESTMSPATSQ